MRFRQWRRATGLCWPVLATGIFAAASVAAAPVLMPRPTRAVFKPGQLALRPAFTWKLAGSQDAKAFERIASVFLARVSQAARVRVELVRDDSVQTEPMLTVQLSGSTPPRHSREYESYSLDVTEAQIRISAATPTGVTRALATLLQLLHGSGSSAAFSCASIVDSPRFPWRGLMLDPARHFIPIETIKRQIDAMWFVKLNVLHLHLSDDQGFRFESRRFPRLQQVASDGRFYTQDQIADLIRYADARGVRVIPEFDLPGHALSWLVAYPELGSAPGPFALRRTLGSGTCPVDPTRESVYNFLRVFFSEVASVFKDDYIHIGEDEVAGEWWDRNPAIRQFRETNGFQSNRDLETYFTRRLVQIVISAGKNPIAWSDVLSAGQPGKLLVQTWSSSNAIGQAVYYQVPFINSLGFFLDEMKPAGVMYRQMPASARFLQGGEACMWGEGVFGENLDVRVWPRSAAVAETLWSATLDDEQSLYARLALMSDRMRRMGLIDFRNLSKIDEWTRNPNDANILKSFIGLLVPRTWGWTDEKWTTFDLAAPESAEARRLGTLVDRALAPGSVSQDRNAVTQTLLRYQKVASEAIPILRTINTIRDAEGLAVQLRDAAQVGIDSIAQIESGKTPDQDWIAKRNTAMEAAGRMTAEAYVAVIAPVRRLLLAAQSGRA